jgi:hypothetical protein
MLALILSMFGLLALVLVVFVRRWLVARALRRRENAADEERCFSCGYSLRGLELPRCPECGALRGFDVPLSQLGIGENELRAMYDAKHAGDAPGSPLTPPTRAGRSIE